MLSDTEMAEVQKLAQAKQMLDQGLINDSEYEAMKARIISAMSNVSRSSTAKPMSRISKARSVARST